MNADKTAMTVQALDKLGLDDALVRGQQAEAVNARGGGDRAVGGISRFGADGSNMATDEHG